MNTHRSFAADTNKLAYAQAFSRTSAPHAATSRERVGLRALAARLHRANTVSR